MSDQTTATHPHKLVLTREFNAPRELVWNAWTEPAQVKSWLRLGDDMTVESAQMDLRAGGRFRLQTRRPDGEYFTAAGAYLEVDPPARLVYTWDWEKDGAGAEYGELEGAETLLTVEFRAIGEKRTELVLTHEKFTSAERRDRHVEGWTNWLDRMGKFLDAKEGN